MKFRLLGLLALTAACSGGPIGDPFEDLNGKADRENFFDSDNVRLELDGDTFTVWAQGRRARYRDVTRTSRSNGLLSVKLDSGDALADRKTFLFAEINIVDFRSQESLASAMGVPHPQGVAASFDIDGETVDGVLIEHVGDRFLEDALNASGDVVRSDEPLPTKVLNALSDGTRRDLHDVTKLSTYARYLAFEEVLGSTAPVSHFSACDVPCYQPVVDYASIHDASRLWPAAFRKGAVAYARDVYLEGLRDAQECLSDACELGQAPLDRVSALLTWDAANDLPSERDSKSQAYSPIERVDEDFVFRFRNTTEWSLVSVTLQLSDGRRFSLKRNRSQDVWELELAATDLPANLVYNYELSDEDRTQHTVVDPNNAQRESEWSTVELELVDQLIEMDTTDVDFTEPSGLAFGDGVVYAVGDERDDVFVLHSETFEILEEIDIGVRGLEGIAYDAYHQTFLVADEERGSVFYFRESGEQLQEFPIDWAEDIGGIEGLSIRPYDGHLFVVKERNPARIAEFAHQEELNRETIDWAPDLSAIEWSRDDGYLYALSDQDRTLYRLDENRNVLASYRLSVDKPEGLAIQNGVVIVSSDTDETVTRFELNAWRF